jgi:hypothetical protein
MVRRLANGVNIVMAVGTTYGYAGVIEPDIGPGGVGDMTIIASRVGLNMIGRFSGCRIAIMAAGTGPGHNRVIKVDLLPIVG